MLRELKRSRETKLQLAKSDLEVTLKAGRERGRLAKSAAIQPSAGALSPHAQAEPLVHHTQRSLRRELAGLHSAVAPEMKQQRDQIAARRRHPEVFDTRVGDPTLWGYIAWADVVTVDSTQVVVDGNLNLIPPTPLTENHTPGVNTVRFAAVASSQIGYEAQVASLVLDTTHVFSFKSWLFASCVLTGWFLPNAVFSLHAPAAVYFFPFYHAVPHARLRFSLSLRVDHFLPDVLPGQPPTQTLTDGFVRPAVELSGWMGPVSQSGGLDLSPQFFNMPAFLVAENSRVVITAQYHVEIFAWEGGSVTFDAISFPNSGLNVPEMDLFLDY